jgi:hypothetical protein
MGTTGAFRLVVQLWRGEQRGSAMICVEMLQVRGAMRPALAVGVRTGDRNSWMPQLSIALSKMAENVLSIVQQKSVALIGWNGFSQLLPVRSEVECSVTLK